MNKGSLTLLSLLAISGCDQFQDQKNSDIKVTSTDTTYSPLNEPVLESGNVELTELAIPEKSRIEKSYDEEEYIPLSFEDEDYVKEQCFNCWELVNQLRLINGNAITFKEAGNSDEASFRFAIQAMAPNIYASWVYTENNIYGSQIDKKIFKEWISTEEHKTVLSLIKSSDI
jgi:hypothetical protein